MKISALITTAIGAAVMFAPVAEATAAEPILLGQIAELTGGYTSLGVDTKLGAEQAVAEINAAGGLLDGRQIRLIVKDDKTRPDQTVIAFNELFDAGVSAVVGPVFSNASLAVMDQVNRRKLPMISTAAADQQVTPYMFIDSPLQSVVAEQLLRYFQASNITRIAIAYASDQAFGKDGMKIMSNMMSKYGVKLIKTETFESGTTNFASVLTHVRESDAQALMVWAAGPAPVILTKQFADGKMAIPLVMSHAQATTLYTKPAGAAAHGVVLAASLGVVGKSLPPSKVKDAVDVMATTFEANVGYYPSQFAFAGYSAVKLIAGAISRSNSTDRTAIRDALVGLTQLTPLGEYHYTEEDHAGLTKDDIAIAKIETDGSIVPTAWSAAELKKVLQ